MGVWLKLSTPKLVNAKSRCGCYRVELKQDCIQVHTVNICDIEFL